MTNDSSPTPTPDSTGPGFGPPAPNSRTAPRTAPGTGPSPAPEASANATPQPVHKRRPRYRGKNPRRFEEKYKEHQPERYAGDVAHIIATGKTPAGSHRPILVREILEVLQPAPGQRGIDATLGYGGHARELLQRLQPGGRLLAVDVDPIELPRTEERLRTAGFGPETLTVIRTNFAGLPQAMASVGFEPAHFLLADLGLSSMQIDNPARGFTFKWEGPFDLRLNPQKGLPASQLVRSLAPSRLEQLLRENADEPRAALLASALCQAAARDGLETTVAAAQAVREALEPNPQRRRPNPETDAAIRRVFQAIRIAVNDEFGVLDTLLRHLPSCLRPGGRAALLTFHSGEDRRVKRAFLEGHANGTYASIAHEVIRPSPDEIRSNSRAAPAKLRWAIRAGS